MHIKIKYVVPNSWLYEQKRDENIPVKRKITKCEFGGNLLVGGLYP